mmetsp:Transcript_3116/g.8459  ORF Transcript_3116/g.8459 Transcript_3116/m.8459 type:complete len:265 (-) Transcript_3116:31-825(-)
MELGGGKGASRHGLHAGGVGPAGDKYAEAKGHGSVAVEEYVHIHVHGEDDLFQKGRVGLKRPAALLDEVNGSVQGEERTRGSEEAVHERKSREVAAARVHIKRGGKALPLHPDGHPQPVHEGRTERSLVPLSVQSRISGQECEQPDSPPLRIASSRVVPPPQLLAHLRAHPELQGERGVRHAHNLAPRVVGGGGDKTVYERRRIGVGHLGGERQRLLPLGGNGGPRVGAANRQAARHVLDLLRRHPELAELLYQALVVPRTGRE